MYDKEHDDGLISIFAKKKKGEKLKTRQLV